MNTTIATILSTVIATIITWIVSRQQNAAQIRKIKAEAEKIELGSTKEIIEMWRGTALEFQEQVKKLTQKCDELTKEIEVLRKENRTLTKKLEQVINNQNH